MLLLTDESWPIPGLDNFEPHPLNPGLTWSAGKQDTKWASYYIDVHSVE